MKVFVSSPVTDLREARLACRATLEELGLEWFIAEHEGSKASDSLSVCLNAVATSDIVVLLLGQRYGYVMPSLGISVTECEFNKACDLAKPVLVYNLDFFDREPRQQAFMQKVESMEAASRFRGEPIRNVEHLTERLKRDIVEFLQHRQALYPTEATEDAHASSIQQSVRSVAEHFRSLTTKGRDVAYFYDSVYVPRDVEDSLNVFLRQGDKRTCALVGAAGSGKSSIVGRLVEDLRTAKDVILVHFQAKYLERGNDLTRQILANLPVQESRTDEDRLARFLKSSRARLIILLDGINEVATGRIRSELRAGLANLTSFVSRAGGHLIITCRDLDWDGFIRDNPRLQANLYLDELRSDAGLLAIRLPPYTRSEQTRAFERYASAFELQGSLTPKLAWMCRNPWMLRVLADTYEGQQLPTDIRMVDLFNAYYRKKMTQIHAADFAALMLAQLADFLLAEGRESVPAPILLGNSEEATPHALQSLFDLRSVGLLNCEFMQGSQDLCDSRVRFADDRLTEYMVARRLTPSLEERPGEARNSQVASQRAPESMFSVCGTAIPRSSTSSTMLLSTLMDALEPWRLACGIIEFAVLLAEDANQRDELVREMMRSSQPLWQLTALSLANKTENRNAALQVSGQLLKSNNPSVRGMLATTLVDNFEEVAEDIALNVLAHLLNDNNPFIVAKVVPCFVEHVHMYPPTERQRHVAILSGNRNQLVQDQLALSVFDRWKLNNDRFAQDIIEQVNPKELPERRHAMAYLAMKNVSNPRVRRVLENALVSDLISSSNYAYGPWCVTMGELYHEDQQMFDLILPLLRSEPIPHIQERYRVFVEPSIRGAGER